MPSWKKVITSGSNAMLSSLYTSGDVSSSASSIGSFGQVKAGTLSVTGDINASEYIYHKDNTNTNIRFTDDRIRIKAGGISYIDLNDAGSAPHDITFNDGSNNIDFIVKGNSDNPLFKTDASTNRIGTNGQGSPSADFHIGGNLKVQSHITASANISASGTIYGDNLRVVGNITTQGDIIAKNYIVSSSVTHLTQSYSSGSTVFGNTADDKHQFTGSVSITGSLSMTGEVIPSTDATVDLGSDTKRFANLYTADIQLSNEQKGPNDIDGTTGKWTIQEGENDLFLINRRTGAKFKFIIEQVG